MKGAETMPKVNKEFDKAAYDKAYHKKHYKQSTVVFTIDEAERVEAAAAASGMSKSQYIKSAVFEKIERE